MIWNHEALRLCGSCSCSQANAAEREGVPSLSFPPLLNADMHLFCAVIYHDTVDLTMGISLLWILFTTVSCNVRQRRCKLIFLDDTTLRSDARSLMIAGLFLTQNGPFCRGGGGELHIPASMIRPPTVRAGLQGRGEK